MKSLLATITMLGLLSCHDTKQQKHDSREADSSAITEEATGTTNSVAMLQKLQAYAYDSSIYDAYLPADLKTFLSTHMKDWQLPHPDEWDTLWFQSYKSPNSLVNFISGDFNCDLQKDYALLLSNKSDSSIAAWAIHSGDGGFTAIKLEEFDKPDNHIQLGLELIEAGNLNYIDPDIEDIKTIELKCPAVQVILFETAATTYYWNKGKYDSVQTGD